MKIGTRIKAGPLLFERVGRLWILTVWGRGLRGIGWRVGVMRK